MKLAKPAKAAKADALLAAAVAVSRIGHLRREKHAVADQDAGCKQHVRAASCKGVFTECLRVTEFAGSVRVLRSQYGWAVFSLGRPELRVGQPPLSYRRHDQRLIGFRFHEVMIRSGSQRFQEVR